MCVKLLPSHLLLTNKRFNFDYRTNKSTKINDHVRVPLCSL